MDMDLTSPTVSYHNFPNMPTQNHTTTMATVAPLDLKTTQITLLSPRKEFFYNSNKRQLAIRDMSVLEEVVPMLHRSKHGFYSKNQRSASLRDVCAVIPKQVLCFKRKRRSTTTPFSLYTTEDKHHFYSENERSSSLRSLHCSEHAEHYTDHDMRLSCKSFRWSQTTPSKDEDVNSLPVSRRSMIDLKLQNVVISEQPFTSIPPVKNVACSAA